MSAPPRKERPLYVGITRCSLQIPQAFSLKDRRKVVRSFQERFRQKNMWNLSVIDLSLDHVWNSADLALVTGGICYSSTLEKLHRLEEKIFELADHGEFSVICLHSEVLEYGKHTYGKN